MTLQQNRNGWQVYGQPEKITVAYSYIVTQAPNIIDFFYDGDLEQTPPELLQKGEHYRDNYAVPEGNKQHW